MRTRFYNARILTMKDFDVFSGEVWIEDNKIIYVGKVKTSTFWYAGHGIYLDSESLLWGL